MSGYPYSTPPPQYGAAPPPYGAAPPPYGAAPQYPASAPYGAAPSAPSYGAGAPPTGPYGGSPSAPSYGGAPPTGPYGGSPSAQSYGGAPPTGPYGGAPSAPSYGGTPSSYGGAPSSYGSAPAYGGYEKPGKPAQQGYAPSAPPAAGYGLSPFAALVPSAFPPGTDPNVVACFQAADQDGSGFIDDRELQQALSSYNQSFSLRTVKLLMYLFTGSNVRRIGPKEFSSLFYSLQNWRDIFERFDRDRSGRIDASELREALLSLGFSVSPVVLELLMSKFDNSGGRVKAIQYDNFIECCLTVKGLTEKFKEKDVGFTGSATFDYESFMLTVLPFLIA